MLRGSLGYVAFQKIIVHKPRGMGGDEALHGPRHGVCCFAAVALVSISTTLSAISLSYQSRCKHLSISVSSASLRISPHAGPVNPQQNKTSFAPFGSGNWKFELTVCLLACLLGRSRSIIILGRCRDGGAVAGWG